MSLGDCVRYALQNSPELQRKEIKHENQKLGTQIEKADFALNLEARSERAYDSHTDNHWVSLNKKIPGGVEVSGILYANDTFSSSIRPSLSPGSLSVKTFHSRSLSASSRTHCGPE